MEWKARWIALNNLLTWSRFIASALDKPVAMSQKSEISSSDGAIVLMVILVVGVVLDDSTAWGKV